MKKNFVFLILEYSLIFIYIILIQYSFIIQPIITILGIICVLCIPGYNLIKLIKPNSTNFEKIGLMVIFSLAIENIFMLLYYMFTYNQLASPLNPGFYFNDRILIFSIQISSLLLILINEIRSISQHKKNSFREKKINLGALKIKNVSIVLGFITSLFLMCFTIFYNSVTVNDFNINYIEYSSNYTFFVKAPLFFYLFLVMSIAILVYIIFTIKNQYIIFFSISAFMYCLWILPYLQIGYYFSYDSYVLQRIYNNYVIYGIRAESNYPFLVRLGGFTTYRYSTSLFSSILIVSSTGVDINTALWYIYPVVYIFLPFYIYSIFKKYSTNPHRNNNSLFSITLFIIFTLLTPQFLKYTHTASTGAIGAFIFLILIIEFYELVYKNDLNLKARKFSTIILLYLFLCLTHFEESFYFLAMVTFFIVYFLLFEIKEDYSIDNISEDQFRIGDKDFLQKNVKKYLINLGTLLITCSLIFYIFLEFFGNISLYFLTAAGNNSFLTSLFNIYLNSKISLPLLGGNFQVNLYIIGFLILVVTSFIMISYICFFKYNRILRNALSRAFKKIFNFIKYLFKLKLFPIVFFLFFFSLILAIELFYIKFLLEEGIYLIFEIVLNYSIFILQLYLIFKGIFYHKSEIRKRNFFLLSIFVSTLIFSVLFIVGDRLLAYYIFNSRFPTYLVFFGFFIIQNTYFKEFIKMKKRNLMIITFVLLSFGVFLSLRKLSWG